MSQTKTTNRSFTLPPQGDNPSTDREGTNPASFANRGQVGTAYTYSSPDTPGMPGVSDITAMDFAAPRDVEGKTQLEEARIGIVTPQMSPRANRT
jgi:phosphomethylpyrimidine synthase